MISEHTHDHNLAEYCWMDLCKCLEWYPKFKRTRRLEFYCVEQSKTADLADHFVFGEALDEHATKALPSDCRALSEGLVLQDIKRGQAGAHREAIFTEGRGVDQRALERAVDRIADSIRHQHSTAWNQPAAECFGQNDHVGLDSKMVCSEEWTSPVQTSLDLIQDEKRIVTAAEHLNVGEVVPRRHKNAALTLDWL